MAGSVCPARARPSVAIKRDCFDRPSPPRTSPVFPSETRRKTCRKPPKTPGASGFGMDWGVGSRVQPISIARDLDPRARRLTPPASGPPPNARTRTRAIRRRRSPAHLRRAFAPEPLACPFIGRPRQAAAIPPNHALAPACRYAATTRRARAGTPRIPSRPGAVFFLQNLPRLALPRAPAHARVREALYRFGPGSSQRRPCPRLSPVSRLFRPSWRSHRAARNEHSARVSRASALAPIVSAYHLSCALGGAHPRECG